jgi:copper resistance protein B
MRFLVIPSAMGVAFAAVVPQMALAQDRSAHHHSAPVAPVEQVQVVAAPVPDGPQGTDQSPGSAAPPPVAHDRPADRYWDRAAMAKAESAMMDAHSAPRFSAVKVDLAEYQFGARAGDSYHWEGEGWVGDVNRLVLRTRGEGGVGQRMEQAQVEAAYARAISPWWNLQAGVRQDVRPTPERTHAMVGIEGLAPYKFDFLAAAYLSDKGQITARIEGAVEERITRRIVVQPRAEFNLSAQDRPELHLGAGVNSAEAGVRLRYEISRKFAPYVGMTWGWALGKTADYRRAEGERTATRAIVLGIKSWF